MEGGAGDGEPHGRHRHSGRSRRPRRGHEQDRRRQAARQEPGDPDRGPAERVHPRPLLQVHAAHARPEPDLLLPRGRRAGHLRHRHREVRQHVQRRRAAPDGGRRAEPAREDGHARASRPSCRTWSPRRTSKGEVLAFSVPAAIEGKESELTYHEATLRSHFEAMGYKAVAINEGLAVDLLRARGRELHRHRHLLRRRHVQRHPRLPVDPVHHVQHHQGRRLHRPLGGRGGERARHPREGHQGRGPRPQPRRRATSSRRRCTSTTRTSWSRW